jgi:hypothetical protein
MTAAVHVPLRLVTCRGICPAGPTRAHHDRLLTIDTDEDALLELMDLAVTWHELDYSERPVVGPQEWETFAERHTWARPDRAEWAFMLAADIVRRGRSRDRRTTVEPGLR